MNPLVSILIPTYNRPYYLEQALQSALNQTYSNIEIVISDNSEDDKTEQVVHAYLSSPNGSKIRYVRNQQNIGPIPNQQQCFDLSTGEYINYLMDDDMLHPRKIEKMIKYLIDDKKITLVTSRRQIIDGSGQPIRISSANVTFKQLNIEKSYVKGRTAISEMLQNRKNYIGEPTTPLFRKKDLKEPFGTFLGYQAKNSVDAASWLSLLAKKNFVYLEEPLSSYRKHSGQLANSTLSLMGRLCDWIMFILVARENGLFKDTTAFIQSINELKIPVLDLFLKWNEMTNDLYIDEFIIRAKLLVQACEKKKRLALMANDFKALLDDLERRKREIGYM